MKKIVDIMGKISPPIGRLERVKIDNKYLNIFIDYAHTPDALEKALIELRKIAFGKLIVIFGCGGDRDRSKRPIMGKIACKIADFVIITDDNPRTENANRTRKEILAGIENVDSKYIEIGNRKEAIEYAIKNFSDDFILIAGKGHENYQIIDMEKFYFSDYETVLNFFKK